MAVLLGTDPSRAKLTELLNENKTGVILSAFFLMLSSVQYAESLFNEQPLITINITM